MKLRNNRRKNQITETRGLELVQHDYSIDILKSLAVILIANSHMDLLYGRYAIFATGGAIGDALFFFCSGYTLLLGRDMDFFNWYKRRINRIYPTVFAWALVRSIFGEDMGMKGILMYGGGWFVSCIMIYYVVLWFVKRFAIRRLTLVMAVTTLFVIMYYYLIGIGDLCRNDIFGHTYFKWVSFFIYMLLGSMLGYKKKGQGYKDGESQKHMFVTSLFWVMLSVVCFYGLYGFKKCEGWLIDFQLLSLIPLAGVCYFMYQLCNTSLVKKVFNNRICGPCIKIIGGLCLEIYLVQSHLFTDKMNSIFPINLFIMFAIIIFAAYILRCLARIWIQTFKDAEYNLFEIFKLF